MKTIENKVFLYIGERSSCG